MQLEFSREDEQFREQVADWLRDNLCGSFESIRGRGGPGDEHHYVEERKDWERCLAEGGWTCIGWPEAWGGRGASIEQQVIFHEEYARAGGPGRMGHIGETLTGPTLLAFGSDDQKQRFLPDIRSGQSFWCQGYSEPAAGSDLSNIKTRAEWDDQADVWRFYGQKVWTSLAHESDFIFVLARTDPAERGHLGLGFFLVPLVQEGIEPVMQMTCRDRNRIAIAADLIGASALGIRNLLALSGDDPKGGDEPEAKAVFDLGSKDIMTLSRRLSDDGQTTSGRSLATPASLFVGAADAPFDPPADWEPTGLLEKIAAGTQFVQTQFCYEPEVLKRYLTHWKTLA